MKVGDYEKYINASDFIYLFYNKFIYNFPMQ